MNWLRRFMMGRYGGDQLSMGLVIFSILLTFIGELTHLQLLGFIGYIPLGISIFRVFSRDVQRRRTENYKFTMLISPIYSWFKKKQSHVKDRKTHAYFICPNCKRKLRLPKGKGKIIITCPICKTEFKQRT